MIRIRQTILLALSLISVFTGISANIDSETKLLVNYRRMTPKDHSTYANQRKEQKAAWEKYSIPENFRIPVELQSFRTNRGVKYYAIYNPEYRTGVGYVPSSLSGLYEEEAWRAFQNSGTDAPSLSIVLAQQFTESAFNPQATGDNNKSYGLPQLYLNTAKYLYKTDRETWKAFFYFDKNGKHHFHNVRCMVRFPFEFLPKIKRYTAEQKFEGVRRYNGAGKNAVIYAEKVIKRSLFYEELFSQYNALPLDTAKFKENLFGIINLTLASRNEETVSNDLLEDLLQNALADYQSGYVNQTYYKYYRIMSFENEPDQVALPSDYKLPKDGKDYYLIVEDGHTLYSYFKDPTVVLGTLNHEKNSAYFIYLKVNGKIIRINQLRDIGKQQVFTNVRPGDKIYIPPGTIIRSPKTNLAVMIN